LLLGHKLPELLLVQQRDLVALLPEPFYLHQLQPTVAACGLKRVGTAADDDSRECRRPAVHDRAGARGRAHGLLPPLGQNAGEGQMHLLQAAKHSALQPWWRRVERVDQLARILIALPPLTDAAMDDLFQMIAAPQRAQ